MRGVRGTIGLESCLIIDFQVVEMGLNRRERYFSSLCHFIDTKKLSSRNKYSDEKVGKGIREYRNILKYFSPVLEFAQSQISST